MKTSLVLSVLSAAGLCLGVGCESKTTYVNPNSSRLVTSVGTIDVQDFAQAADSMTQSLIDNLINAGKLQSAVPSEPALMAISRIQNNTAQQLDTDMLVKKIRVALNRTGKVQTSTTIQYGGAEDPLAAEQQAQAPANPQKRPRAPDYTLSGKIIEMRDQAGNIRQASYVFQLSLSSPDGIAVWEDEKTIVKQSTRPAVGF
jgi:uncharacterized protein (TIGR02722 family)